MKLALLGGGGFRAPLVYGALASADTRVRVDRLALYDIDPGRLRVMSAVLDGLADRCPHPPAVEATTDLDAALRGADFIFCAIREGGAAGRRLDERIALDLGVLGQETVGPGGLAFALRTLPAMDRIARRVQAVAPEAWIVNFTNPAGIVTEALRRRLGERVVGICDSPSGLLERAARAAAARCGSGTEVEDFDYVGLNHLGWLRRLVLGGRDRLADLMSDDEGLAAVEEARLVGLDWTRALGALPNEYLYYYYRSREAVAAIRSAGPTRGEFLADQQRAFYDQAAADPANALAAWQEAHARRDDTYMSEARPATPAKAGPDEAPPARASASGLAGGGYHGAAIGLMDALVTGEPARLILNVPNGALVPQLPATAVIEGGCDVDADGIHPRPVAPVGGHMLGLMASVKACEELVIEAAEAGSRAAAWQAFALHPLVNSTTLGRRLLDAYAAAHPQLARFG